MKFTKNKIPYNISKDILQEQLQEQLQASADRDCKRLNSPAPTIKVIKTKNTCRDFHISKEFNDEKDNYANYGDTSVYQYFPRIRYGRQY